MYSISTLHRCSRCHLDKASEEFHASSIHRHELFPWCRACSREYRHKRHSIQVVRDRGKKLRKQWCLDNPIKVRIHRRRVYLKHQYGLSEADFVSAHASRGGCCDICRVQCQHGPRHDLAVRCDLVVDHCHLTRTFRGLLCDRCNVGVGKFKDDPELLTAASRYVARHGLRAENKQ